MHTPKWEACRIYYLILTRGEINKVLSMLLLASRRLYPCFRRCMPSFPICALKSPSNIFYILLLRGNGSFKILRQLQKSSLVTSLFSSGDAGYLTYIACWNFIYFIKQIGKKRLHGQIHLGASRVKFINREVS